MGERHRAHGRRIGTLLTQRGYSTEGALLRALRQRRRPASSAVRGVTRRDFVGGIGLAGATLGAPALLAGCGGGDGSGPPAGGGGGGGPGPGPATEQRTLFFNFSHLTAVSTPHYLNIGSRKMRLTPVAEAPQVLRIARQSNAFLRAVPDDQITHHLEGVNLSTAAVTLVYMTCNEQPDAGGTWEMTSMHFNIPSRVVGQAYARARALVPSGALPLSGKRRSYGMSPAVTAQDLLDEQVLVDTNSHAEALVGLHPDCLSIEPGSAAHIHNFYISPNNATTFLAGVLRAMGPAAPQGAASSSGKRPWATLLPLVDNSRTPPVPWKKSDGKLNQYSPDWNGEVDTFASLAIGSVQPLLKNDSTLGSDVTGLATPTAPIGALSGVLWHRSDGVPTVMADPSAGQAASTLKFDFQHKSFDAGLGIPTPTSTELGDTRVQVTIDNVSNWFLRFLGVYVRFTAPGPDGQVIPVASLPADTITGQTDFQKQLNQTNGLFLGVLPPAFTLAGIPVAPGFVSETFKIPASAAKATFILGGFGLNGGDPYTDDADNYRMVGGLMTLFVNFVMVSLCTALGVSDLDAAIKVIGSIAAGLASSLVSLLGAAFDWRNVTASGIFILVGRLLGVVLNALYSTALVEIAIALATIAVTAEVIDAVPVAGQVARAVAAAIGGISLAQTTIECALSPMVYVYDGALTHNLGVNLLPDKDDGGFPTVPPGYTLYYKVSYLFDSGTAHMLDAVDLADPSVPSIAVLLGSIPRGGQVNIKAGFYMRRSSTPAGQNDWCAGFGETGLFANTADQAPDLRIKQNKIAIQPSTQYLHTRKTTLDGQGHHLWATTPTGPPYTAPPNGQLPGLGGFRGITVRQSTSDPLRQGYVGYAWKAYSTGVVICGGTSPGQLDQMANLNTDDGNGGTNAENGYLTFGCGQQAGASIAYDLLLSNTQNFYLDPATLFIRQVQLDPPAFVRPGSMKSFGKLNLDSNRLLLHPAGHVVSINAESHKLETLKLALLPQSDTDAASKYLARTYAGLGSRPGLIKSPAAVAISPDGVILVLEGSGGNNRVQAFDLGGNPVPYFKQQKTPYFLQLDATASAQYLDLAVEFTGYLYVLSADGSNNHRLDIYHPGQTGTQPICTTRNVNAARLAVDLWRSVYTLNYEVLLLPNGNLPSVSEPSVSLWSPTPPAT